MRNLIKKFAVDAGDTDCFNLLKLSSLLNYLQISATEHANIMGLSRDKLVSENSMIWILARAYIELDAPIHGNDEVTIETWHRGLSGPIWYRDFNISVNSKHIGKAVNAWVIADAVTHKMKRPIGLEVIDEATSAPERSYGITLGKLRCKDELHDKFEKTIRYSDMDINCHLNNAKYADLICDAIDMETLKPCYFKKLQINYNNECKPNEKIILKSNLENTFVSGVDAENQNKFSAEFILDFA